MGRYISRSLDSSRLALYHEHEPHKPPMTSNLLDGFDLSQELELISATRSSIKYYEYMLSISDGESSQFWIEKIEKTKAILDKLTVNNANKLTSMFFGAS